MQYNGFIKSVCLKEKNLALLSCIEKETEVYKISESQLPDGKTISVISNLCFSETTKSPSFYQTCGKKPEVLFLSRDYPCGYICNLSNNGRPIHYHVAIDDRKIAPFIFKSTLCSVGYIQLLASNMSLYSFPTHTKCDGYCVETRKHEYSDLCDDERWCHGYTYGMYCDRDMKYVSNQYFCDGKADCRDKSDELSCKNTSHVQKCRKYNGVDDLTSQEIVPIYEFNRCGPIKLILTNPIIVPRLNARYCVGYEDQTNCSDPYRVGIHCKIKGFMSTVSALIICDPHNSRRAPLCDDGLDMMCVSFSSYCVLHKHYLCDQRADCYDNSDENSPICSHMTDITCERYGWKERGNIPFPRAWLRDGVTDCWSGVDEAAVQLTCGAGATKRFATQEESKACQEVFLCEDGARGFVEFKDLCGRHGPCRSEKKVCYQSQGVNNLFTNCFELQNTNHLLHCQPGLNEISFHNQYNCTLRIHDWPGMEDLKGRTHFPEVLAPNSTVNCRNVFGKTYVYLNCLGLCTSSKCPLSRVSHASCRGQYPRRVYTIDTTLQYLTFMIPRHVSGGGVKYHFDFFPCSTGKCVEYHQLCDLVDDCGDQSDEENCDNNFRCTSGKQFLPLSMVCDGKIDCNDMSDECNEWCHEHIVHPGPLNILLWLLAPIALLFNLVTLVRNLYQLCKCKKVRQMFRVVFLILINAGNLLVASHTLLLVIFNGTYGRYYCGSRLEWLTSKTCSALGILSTLGNLVSVVSMTFLSINEFAVYKWGELLESRSINKSAVISVTLLVLVTLSIATSISLLPVLTFLEDFFVSGIVYSKDNSLFIGILKKQKLIKILGEYYGRFIKNKPLSWTNQTLAIESLYKPQTSLSWKFIRLQVSNMFSRDYTVVWPDALHFYGNDATCQFKYLITKTDPQLYYVLAVISLHASSLFIIVLCYARIWKGPIFKSPSELVAEPPQNERITRENMMMQHKILAITATHFLCWAALLIFDGIHYAELLDITSYYTIVSLIVIRVNSVIMPVILDHNFHYKNMKNGFRTVKLFSQNMRRILFDARGTETVKIFELQEASVITANTTGVGMMGNVDVS